MCKPFNFVSKNIARNPAILLVLSAIWIFLSLTTIIVMVLWFYQSDLKNRKKKLDNILLRDMSVHKVKNFDFGRQHATQISRHLENPQPANNIFIYNIFLFIKGPQC